MPRLTKAAGKSLEAQHINKKLKIKVKPLRSEFVCHGRKDPQRLPRYG